MVNGNTKKLVAEFYKNSGGKEPVRDWIMSLDREDRCEIGSDINNIELHWPIGMPLCRPLGIGLYEVRSNLSDGRISRVIFLIEQNKMILLHGFIKKSQKIPDKEMFLAIKRQKEIKNL